jgi:outer membrane protein TolC
LVLSKPALLPAQSSATRGTIDLRLQDFLRNVLERNESIQMRMLSFEANRRRTLAEYGTFEPEFTTSIQRDYNKRENTVEQQRSQGTGIFEEKNNIYQTGLEALVPTGARVRLGYTLRDLNNNLPSSIFSSTPHTNDEYQTFFGLTLTQPLLKNAGFSATLAGVRIAALASDVAYQDYRRQMMLIISTAEASYWNLYLAQEQVRFFQESVGTAEKILTDNRTRLQTGKGAEIEVLEAEAGLALRRSKLSEAEQKLYEAANRVISLYSETVVGTNRLIRAVDQPQVNETPPAFFDAWQMAFSSNPDYLIQKSKALQEFVRVGYAKNQRLPDLDLKASYGLNGLGETPSQSWDDIQRNDFPSWSIGVELRLPLAGNIKARNELIAARLKQREALVGLREVETQVANALDTAMHKVRSAQDSARSYETVASFNQNLLDAALARLDVGKIESRKVLEVEADLFESRNSVVEALVQYERAMLELELMEGAVLKNRNFDLTQRELESRTSLLAAHGNLTDEQYRQFILSVQKDYENKTRPPGPPDNPEQEKARKGFYEYLNSWDQTNAPPVLTNSPMQQRMFDSLRPLTSPPAPEIPTNAPPSQPESEADRKLRESLRDKLNQLKP